jgi:hypothetical protein
MGKSGDVHRGEKIAITWLVLIYLLAINPTSLA